MDSPPPQDAQAAVTWQGQCHCGAVRFEVDGPLTETTSCDCSLCRMKNARMTAVPASRFRLLTDPRGVTEYRWNTRVARHYFCPVCGIYTFHRKRIDPALVGVNAFCLAGLEVDGLPHRRADGRTMSLVPGARAPGRDGPPD